MNLDSEAKLIVEVSQRLLAEGRTLGAQEAESVARYIAASERVEDMSLAELVDVLQQAVERSVDIGQTDGLKRAARNALLAFTI